jgi:hypothetical protein
MKWQVDEAGAKFCKSMEAFQVTRGGIGDRLIDWLVSSFPPGVLQEGPVGWGLGLKARPHPCQSWRAV